MFVWFVYETELQRATAQSHAAILSCDKIAGVTSVLKVSSPYHRDPSDATRWSAACAILLLVQPAHRTRVACATASPWQLPRALK